MKPCHWIVTTLLVISASGCNELTGHSNIEYSVGGTNVARVSIIYESGGGTSQTTTTIPWSYSFKAEKGEFLYVSAQIVEGNGSIQVGIRNDGQTVQSATAVGFASIATASGTNDK